MVAAMFSLTASISMASDSPQMRRRLAAFDEQITTATSEVVELERIVTENTRTPDGPKCYLVNSWFLHDCFKKLTADHKVWTRRRG